MLVCYTCPHFVVLAINSQKIIKWIIFVEIYVIYDVIGHLDENAE